MDKEEIKRCQERSKIARSLIRRRKKRRAQIGDEDFSTAKKKKLAAMQKKSDDYDSSSDDDEDIDDGDFETYDARAFSDHGQNQNHDQDVGSMVQANCSDNVIVLIDDDDNDGTGVGIEYVPNSVRKAEDKDKDKEMSHLSGPGTEKLTTGKEVKKRKIDKESKESELSAIYADDTIPEMGERVFQWVTRYFDENKVIKNLLFDDDDDDNNNYNSNGNSNSSSSNYNIEDGQSSSSSSAVGSWKGCGTGPKHPLYFQYQGHSRTIIGMIKENV